MWLTIFIFDFFTRNGRWRLFSLECYYSDVNYSKTIQFFFKGSQFFSFELKGFIVIFQHKTLTTFQIRLLTRNSEHFAVFCSFFEFFLFIKFWVLHFLDFSSEINRIKISIIHSGPESSVYLSNSRFFPSNPWFPLFFPLNSRNYFIVR